MAQTSSNPFTIQIVAAPPPLTAAFRLTSPAGGANLPFTIGCVFQKGQFPSGSTLTLDQGTSQVLVKRLWNDNSVKHAVVSGHVSLTANVPLDIQVVSPAPAPGTALTSADIMTAAPAASLQCGAIGTVQLASLLATPFRTWVSGPEMVECHYRAKVGTDASLVAWFHVRLYRSGRMWVRVICENGYLDVNTVDKSYVPTVSIGGTQVYNNGGASLTNYANTRWDQEGWIGGDPQITPKHNSAQLIATKLVPNYWKRNPSENALNGISPLTTDPFMVQAYKPMDHGGWSLTQGDTGFQYDIGLLPVWDALYCTSGDPRAYRAVTAAARSLGTYAIVWRDSANNLPTRPSGRPTGTIDGGGGGSNGTQAGATAWDMAHHGSAGYLAYIVTGDYYYLETMQHQAAVCYLCNGVSQGTGTSRVLKGQSRAMAWSLRTVGQLAAIGPSGGATDAGTVSVTSDYAALLAGNMTAWNTERQRPGQNQIGILYSYEVDTNAYNAAGVTATWQHNFASQTLGHLSDIEPLADPTALNAVRDFYYRWPTGLLGDSGATNFCFTYASSYTVKVSDIQTSDVTNFYDTWGQVFQATNGIANATCGSALLGSSGGDPGVASSGYWGNLMPAIAYAVDHGGTGAAAAFARMTGASNWTDIENCVPPFDDLPNWGIVPRGTLGT
jgi:hypothetical protein